MDDLTRARRNAEELGECEELVPPNPQYSIASELDADEWDAEFRANSYAEEQVRGFASQASEAAEKAGNIPVRDAFRRQTKSWHLSGPVMLQALEDIAETLENMAPCPEEVLDRLLACAQSAIRQGRSTQ